MRWVERAAPVRVPAPRASGSALTRPAVWLLLPAFLAGVVRIGTILWGGFASLPAALSTAIVLFTLYAVPFVLLVRAIDYLEREPWRPQALAVGWGGLVATSAAISGGTAMQNLVAKLTSPRVAAAWGPALSGALVEEALKVLGVVAVVLLFPGQIVSVVDGFVYGALVGLGFQVVENIVFALNAVTAEAGRDAIGPVIGTFLVRGFLAGLWSHTLFTALAGAGIAYGIVRRDRVRLVLCLLAAVGFHFLWNSPLLGADVGLGLVGVIGALLVKGIPALLVGAILLVAAERREADYYAALLAGVADPHVATPEEIVALVSPRRRVAARRKARARLGYPGGRAVGRLQRAQAQLAVALSRDPGAEVLRRRREVMARRHQLLALSVGAAGNPARKTGTLVATGVLVAEVGLALLILFGLAIAIEAAA